MRVLHVHGVVMRVVLMFYIVLVQAGTTMCMFISLVTSRYVRLSTLFRQPPVVQRIPPKNYAENYVYKPNKLRIARTK